MKLNTKQIAALIHISKAKDPNGLLERTSGINGNVSNWLESKGLITKAGCADNPQYHLKITEAGKAALDAVPKRDRWVGLLSSPIKFSDEV